MQGDRDPRWWLRPALIGAGVVGLMVFLVALMPKVFAFRRGSGSAKPALPDNPLLTDYLLIAIVILFVVTSITIRILVQKGAGPTPPKRRPVLLQILTFITILFLVGTVASYLEENEILDPPDPAPTLNSGAPVGAEPERSRPLGLLLSGVLVIVVGGLVAGIVILGRRDKEKVGERPVDEVLAEELDMGLAELDMTNRPREAVIACYVRMERALIEAGVHRRRSDTPYEFIERALESAAVPPDSARKLTALFERARFSPHPTSNEMKEEAMATLEDVRSQLGAVPWQA